MLVRIPCRACGGLGLTKHGACIRCFGRKVVFATVHKVLFFLVLALLLTCGSARAEETPDPTTHGGIVASEVHPAPTVGPETKDETVAIHATTRTPTCASGWTLECGDTGCHCLP